MNFNDLVQSANNEDIQHRLEYLKQKTSQELAQYIINPTADYRDVSVAKKILKERGVTGVPE